MSPRTTTRLLVLSVALNLFLGSAAAMHLMKGPRGRPSPERMVEQMEQSLPDVDKPRFRAAFQPERPTLERDSAVMREFPHKLREALEAEPFDRDHLAAVLQEGAAAHAEIRAAMDRGTLAAVDVISPEGRRHLAHWKGPKK